MPVKSLKPKDLKSAASAVAGRAAPIASAGFSPETIAALALSAKRMKEAPPRAHSKREIEQLLEDIRDRS